MINKTCKMCGQYKSIDKFRTSYNKKYDKMYHSSYCKECATERTREYRRDNRDATNAYARMFNIKSKYRLTEEQYLKMIENGCEICGSHEGLAVDHDHSCCSGVKTCGRCVRGILCRRHNWAIANLNDSVDEALAAAKYLAKKNIEEKEPIAS